MKKGLGRRVERALEVVRFNEGSISSRCGEFISDSVG